MVLERLAELDEDVQFLDAEVDFVEALYDVVDVVGEVLRLRQPDPALDFLLLFFLVSSALHLLFFGFLFLLFLLLLLIFFQFSQSFCLASLEGQAIFFGFEECLLLLEVRVPLVRHVLVDRALAFFHDAEIEEVLGRIFGLFGHECVVVHVVLHSLSLHIITNFSYFLLGSDSSQLPLSSELLFLLSFCELVVLAVFAILILGVIILIFVVTALFLLSFFVYFNFECFSVLSLLLADFDLRFDSNLLQIFLFMSSRQICEFFGSPLQFLVEPFGGSVVLYDVGRPDQEESGALGVDLDVLKK